MGIASDGRVCSLEGKRGSFLDERAGGADGTGEHWGDFLYFQLAFLAAPHL